MQSNSRLSRFEERKNLKSAAILGVITVVLVVLFIFFGLPAMAKFAAFLTDLRKSSLPVETNDTTPPAPPRLEPPPDSTNENSIDLAGSTEPGATIILSLNNNTEEVIANNDGQFIFTLKLNKGSNTISVLAKDTAGNESQKSESVTVLYDTDAPSVEISTPYDGQKFFGPKQRQIVITGSTESTAALTINERFVLVENNGAFTFTTSLSEGENIFDIKVQDKAGNSTQKAIKVSFAS